MRQRAGLIGWLLIMALIVSGCVATRGWVREQADQRVDRAEGRLTQSMQESESRQTQLMREYEGRMTQSLEETRTIASGAAQKADAVDGRLTRLWARRNARTLVETLDVKFGFDRADLDDRAQTALVGLVRELQANPSLSVDLTGYTDPMGPHEYNVSLSQRRVEAVRRFLVQQGIDLPRIHSVGMGPLADGALAAAEKRRVSVKLMVAD